MATRTGKKNDAKIRVTAPARLHLGFLDPDGTLGRKFGSIGLSVDTPKTVLTIAKAATHQTKGFERERVLRLLQRFTGATGDQQGYIINVEQAIPAHAGLGSGTQLAMAVGAALAAMADSDNSEAELAKIGERGARSGIGVSSFHDGGFLIDGGRGTSNTPPPVTLRTDFPEDWRVLLVLDPSTRGVHGEEELEAFASLPPFGDDAAGRVSRLVLMKLLPGLAERNLAEFGAALTEIQQIAGRHFATAQGGSAWTSPAVERLTKRLGDAGAVGIGQSSWGPTGFAFTDEEKKAQALYAALVGEAKATGLDIVIARGRNTGAVIERI